MCERCPPTDHVAPELPQRRKLLAAGLSAAPLIAAGVPLIASARPGTATGASGPVVAGQTSVRAWGATSKASKLAPMTIRRRAPGPKDVVLDILYCGVCHSDIHQARDEWPDMPTPYPDVPGHEIIGRVVAVGKDVTRFKIGDIGGVGCLVDSCGHCENCLADREQACVNGATFTYASPDKVSGGTTAGGYSEKIVVTEHFVIRIPPGANLAATAPLLCAGVTTFSPLQHWHVTPGQRVGVIGMGGLGHIALKLAVARRAEVVVFTTTPEKAAHARRLGAKDVVVWNDAAAMKRYASYFDFMISTVPQAYPMTPFMDLLKLDATLVNVGALEQLQGVNGVHLAAGRKSLAGSLIGGIAETQEVIDYCSSRGITADIELIRPDQINEAFDRVVGKDVRFRFVIDMKADRKVA